jgi:hypothetical protein
MATDDFFRARLDHMIDIRQHYALQALNSEIAKRPNAGVL